MKRYTLTMLILCLTIPSLAQLDSAFFTIDELKAIRKQQIRLHYCDSARNVLEAKDTVNTNLVTSLNQIIERKNAEIQLLDSHNHTLKVTVIESEKAIKRMKRREKWLKVGLVATSSTTLILLMLISVK